MEKRSRLQATVTNFHDPFRPFPRVSLRLFRGVVNARPPKESESRGERVKSKQWKVASARVWNGDLKVSAFSF